MRKKLEGKKKGKGGMEEWQEFACHRFFSSDGFFASVFSQFLLALIEEKHLARNLACFAVHAFA